EVVGRGPRDRDVAADAADRREPPPTLFEVFECRVDRAEHSENVGLELAAVIVEGEALEKAGDSEPGVGDHDVELAEGGPAGGGGPLEIAFTGDVARSHHRPAADGADLGRERLQPVAATRGQHHVGAFMGELEGEGGADARGGTRDEDGAAGESVAWTSPRPPSYGL